MIACAILALIAGGLGGAVSGRHNENAQAQQETAFDRIEKTRTLRCGYILWPPYMDIDAQTGKPKGINVDLMDAIGQVLDVNVVWTEEVGWATMLEGLKASRYDAVCSALWQTPSRSMQATFSTPYGYAAAYAWVRAKDTNVPRDLAKLNDKAIRIATLDGEITTSLAKELYPLAQTVSLPQMMPFADLLMNVVTNKADVVFSEEKIVRDFLKSNPGTLRKLSEKPLTTAPVAIALPQGDVRLKAAIDSALNDIMASPQFDQILAPYGGAEELSLKKVQSPFIN